jgi:hypothetical protein
MNIRKHWKRLLLTTTALFWASCTSENENTFPTIGQDTPPAVDPGASSDSNIESSNENAAESSSSDAVASSSSEAKVPSSSSLNLNAYKLASDPSITCTPSYINGGKCLDSEDFYNARDNILEKIEKHKKILEENQTLTLEQLDSLEEEIIEANKQWETQTSSYYTNRNSNCVHMDPGTLVYNCSNNESYEASTLATDYDNHILYTKEEHRAKFPEKYQSSSSSEPKSSSSATPPSPLCQKSDFATEGDFVKAWEDDKKELLDIAKKELGTKLAEKDSICLDRVENTYLYPSTDVIAKKQTCDGETIVNPRYLQKLDTLKTLVKKRIDKCIEYSKIEQIACDISAMCPEYGVDSKCTYKYSCNDGLSCRRTEGERDLNCSNKQGENFKYTQEEFEKKYYEKRRY